MSTCKSFNDDDDDDGDDDDDSADNGIEHQVDSALAEYEEVCSEAAGAGVDLVSKVLLTLLMMVVMLMIMTMMTMIMMVRFL